MATTLPSPNSSPAVPPASSITPTQPSSSPINPSPDTNTTSSPPASSSQPPLTSPPPAAGASPPLPPATSPPPQSGLPAPVPPSSNSTPPTSNQPQASSPPLRSNPPETSPPPPSSPPPVGTPPPLPSDPPANSPPPSPPSSPPPSPPSSPPPSPSDPPAAPLPPSSPPPRSSDPPANSPPPSSRSSPAPPPSEPPTAPLPSSSPPPPSSDPPANSPPPSSPRSPPPSSDLPTTPVPSSSPPPPPLTATNLPPSPSPQPPHNSPSSPLPSAPNPSENSASPPAPNPPENLTPPPSVPPSNSSTPSNPPPISPTLPNSSSRPPPPITMSPPPPPSLVPPFSPPSTNNSDANTPENSNSEGNGGLGTGGSVAIGLVLGFILLSLIGAAAWYMRRRKKKFSGHNGGCIMPTSVGSSPYSASSSGKHTSEPLMGSGSANGFVYQSAEPGGLGNSRLLFTYKELADATNGFAAQNLLGEGGWGSVYKGCLVDGREVAVKLQRVSGGQQEQEFKAEVQMISHIHHRHLVSLMGYCIYENQRLLVYEYVSNNNLYFHLHGEGRPVMDWATRLKIAVGAARGIAYLHEDCHPRIIHRDIKSSNILLDNNFEARVSDFGLAKLALDPTTHVTTCIMGTFGYMAPEYASCGKWTEKSDVFSFGVVLLELITGRKPVDDSQPLGEECLVEWARTLLNHAVTAEDLKVLIDPRLEKNYTDGEMFLMIEVAAACVRHAAAQRPKIVQVVRAFESLAAEDLTNGMRVGESEIYNSPLQSAEIRSLQRMAFGSQGPSTVFFSQSSCNS